MGHKLLETKQFIHQVPQVKYMKYIELQTTQQKSKAHKNPTKMGDEALMMID